MSEVYSPTSEQDVQTFVHSCFLEGSPIEVMGFGSKAIGREIQCSKTLKLQKFDGIIEYFPDELYIKVKPGTSLELIESTLKQKNQELSFEPSDLGFLYQGKSLKGSVGAAVACNLSGSRRFKAGALRDHLLGFKAINGKGEIIKSGGTVVKNVTGYDVSKLISGSYGTLGVITEIILKVQPRYDESQTLLIYGVNLKKALNIFSQSMQTSFEISGACYYPEGMANFFNLNDIDNSSSITAIRVEGPKISVSERINSLKKLFVEHKNIFVLENYQSRIFWKSTSDISFFKNSENIVVKVSLPPVSAEEFLQQFMNEHIRFVIDWAGNLIWIEIAREDSILLRQLRKKVINFNGHLTIMKAPTHVRIREDFLTVVDENMKKLSLRIKESFDPKSILNPGKMYSGL